MVIYRDGSEIARKSMFKKEGINQVYYAEKYGQTYTSSYDLTMYKNSKYDVTIEVKTYAKVSIGSQAVTSLGLGSDLSSGNPQDGVYWKYDKVIIR
jgi:hypothetical protein